jgi:TolB protein
MIRRVAMAALLMLAPALARAQDTTRAGQGVRIGISYQPGQRPGMLVLGGARRDVLDSVRAILRRDLDYSDRFEMVTLPGGDSLVLTPPAVLVASPRKAAGGAARAPDVFINYALYAALGADYAVAVQAVDSGADLAVYDVRGQALRRHVIAAFKRTDPGSPGFRLAVHRAADEIVRVAAGTPGVAATRLLFVQAHRIYQVDADGELLRGIPAAGANALSPAWAPGGRRIAYMDMVFDGATSNAGRIYVLDLETGQRTLVGPTGTELNFTPAFSPDGNLLAFSRATGEGTDIFTYNVATQCCLQRLTVGRFSDNLSPTYSPDGRRIAFVSDRPGLPQVYVMAPDGTGQELLAPFDYGATGKSNAPDWSPDGLNIAFHRDVAGSPQVFVMDLASRTPRQLTSEGRNEDPSWAPDGRHIAFISDRTGTRQVWVVDIDTGRVRQVTRVGDARLPAWSSRIP